MNKEQSSTKSLLADLSGFTIVMRSRRSSSTYFTRGTAQKFASAVVSYAAIKAIARPNQ